MWLYIFTINIELDSVSKGILQHYSLQGGALKLRSGFQLPENQKMEGIWNFCSAELSIFLSIFPVCAASLLTLPSALLISQRLEFLQLNFSKESASFPSSDSWLGVRCLIVERKKSEYHLQASQHYLVSQNPSPLFQNISAFRFYISLLLFLPFLFNFMDLHSFYSCFAVSVFSEEEIRVNTFDLTL